MLVLFSMLISLSFAQDNDEDELGTFVEDTSTFVYDQGEDWVQTYGATGAGVKTSFTSVYEGIFSPGMCGDQTFYGSGRGSTNVVGVWLAPSLTIILIVAFGIAGLYMVGQFLNSPQLIALAKDEMFQTGLTVLRLVFIMGPIIAGGIWYTISTTDATDPVYRNPEMIDAAMAFARSMVSEMVNHYSMLVMYNMVIHTIYSSTMWFGTTWRAMYSFNLGPVLKPLIDIVGSTLQFLSLGISSWMLHLVTLCIIKKWAWTLFVPVGVLLRSFPYTRSAGEALLSLTFALIIFYPFMFLFDYEVHNVLKNHVVDARGALSSFINKSGILAVFGSVIIIAMLMAGVFVPFFMGGAMTLAFELIRGSVYYVVIMSLLLPFINIFVMLTAAKEMANFFRADVNFMSFLKII